MQSDPTAAVNGHPVPKLSERWGVERLAGGGTQVWAQVPRLASQAV